ncbi:hypothetical protein HYH03_015207 [Edaphochlamys debaryana]|uniref:S-acyltransferase n=1 Tax=Edaphochlamys debaryana TaxID=47281 RepID=A0A835XML8_9CHLO|nr:hypothetical protein HYH03_015207 [Edaphochlamys debaryana]|eukprot:KAG2486112.1 hypothetical protein HYH03_015207 [Edaphochlamys debaryana]
MDPEQAQAAAPAKKRQRVYESWQGNERFFCWGYLVAGPNWKASIGTALLISAPAGVYLGLVAPYMGMHVHVIILVISCILPVLAVWFLMLTACRDPGVIPRQEPDQEYLSGQKPRTKEVYVNNQRVVIRYNDTCHFYQPPRAHHCSVNDNCIERFDHHCPWVGTTIGLRNYRTFLLFVYTSTVLCLYVFGVCVAMLFVKHDQLVDEAQEAGQSGDGLWGKALGKCAPALALMGYTFLFFWFVGGLSVFHAYLVGTNQTTYENFRYNHDNRPNPYSRGIWRNCAEVWCSRVPASKVPFRAYVDDFKPPTGQPYSPYLNGGSFGAAGGNGEGVGEQGPGNGDGDGDLNLHGDLGNHDLAGLPPPGGAAGPMGHMAGHGGSPMARGHPQDPYGGGAYGMGGGGGPMGSGYGAGQQGLGAGDMGMGGGGGYDPAGLQQARSYHQSPHQQIQMQQMQMAHVGGSGLMGGGGGSMGHSQHAAAQFSPHAPGGAAGQLPYGGGGGQQVPYGLGQGPSGASGHRLPGAHSTSYSDAGGGWGTGSGPRGEPPAHTKAPPFSSQIPGSPASGAVGAFAGGSGRHQAPYGYDNAQHPHPQQQYADPQQYGDPQYAGDQYDDDDGMDDHFDDEDGTDDPEEYGQDPGAAHVGGHGVVSPEQVRPALQAR